jgi:hypothetical protein
MQNIYAYQLIVDLEGLQPSGLYIHEQMYISFPSSLVPSSPGTAYHQKYVYSRLSVITLCMSVMYS